MSLVLTSLSSYSISQDEISVNPDPKALGHLRCEVHAEFILKIPFSEGPTSFTVERANISAA